MGASDSPMSRFSVAVVNWTPPVMMVAYLVFSFFFYCLIPVGVHTTFWYLYLGLQTGAALFAAALAIRSIRPNVLSRRSLRKVDKEGFSDLTDDKCPPIDLIVAAQLPIRGHDVLGRQVRYLLRELDYPVERLQVHIVYNSARSEDPMEHELMDLASRHWNLQLHKVQQARGVADKVNYVLSQPETMGHIAAVLNVDQFPESQTLRFVARKFVAGETDVVQCRTAVYKTGGSLWARLSAAEIDLFQGVFAPGRASLDGLGACAGTTAFYSASLIRALQMRHSAVDAAQDLSLRATLSGARVVYDVNAVVVESAPRGFGSWARQRSQWSQSWSQLNARYSFPSLRYGAYGSAWRTRFGLFSSLFIRDGYFHLLAQFYCVIVSTFVSNPPSTWPAAQKYRIGFKVSYWLLIWNLFCILIISAINYRNRAPFTKRFDVLAFAAVSPLYLVMLTFVSLSGQFRELAGTSGRRRR